MRTILLAAAPTYNVNAGGAGTVTGLRAWNASGAAHNLQPVFANLIRILTSSILSVTAAVFITGALMFIIGSFGKEDLKSNGKNMMIGSLIGMAIVLFARAILHIVLYFMYAGSL